MKQYKNKNCSLIYMQNKLFILVFLYICSWYSCNVKYECIIIVIYIWGISVQCCPANTKKEKKKHLKEKNWSVCEKRDRYTVERWKRRPKKDRRVCRCHVCLYTASVKSLCPSRHIQSNTPSQEKLPWRPLLHFISGKPVCLAFRFDHSKVSLVSLL